MNMKVSEDYLKTFAGIVAAEGYTPLKVLNCDKTRDLWKKILRNAYMNAVEIKMPGS